MDQQRFQSLHSAIDTWVAASEQSVVSSKTMGGELRVARAVGNGKHKPKTKPQAINRKEKSSHKRKNKVRCDECGALVFPRKYDLERHKMKHLPREHWPHHCRWPNCFYASVQKPNLVRHIMDIHHGQDSPQLDAYRDAEKRDFIAPSRFENGNGSKAASARYPPTTYCAPSIIDAFDGYMMANAPAASVWDSTGDTSQPFSFADPCV